MEFIHPVETGENTQALPTSESTQQFNLPSLVENILCKRISPSGEDEYFVQWKPSWVKQSEIGTQFQGVINRAQIQSLPALSTFGFPYSFNVPVCTDGIGNLGVYGLSNDLYDQDDNEPRSPPSRPRSPSVSSHDTIQTSSSDSDSTSSISPNIGSTFPHHLTDPQQLYRHPFYAQNMASITGTPTHAQATYLNFRRRRYESARPNDICSMDAISTNTHRSRLQSPYVSFYHQQRMELGHVVPQDADVQLIASFANPRAASSTTTRTNITTNPSLGMNIPGQDETDSESSCTSSKKLRKRKNSNSDIDSDIRSTKNARKTSNLRQELASTVDLTEDDNMEEKKSCEALGSFWCEHNCCKAHFTSSEARQSHMKIVHPSCVKSCRHYATDIELRQQRLERRGPQKPLPLTPTNSDQILTSSSTTVMTLSDHLTNVVHRPRPQTLPDSDSDGEHESWLKSGVSLRTSSKAETPLMDTAYEIPPPPPPPCRDVDAQLPPMNGEVATELEDSLVDTSPPPPLDQTLTSKVILVAPKPMQFQNVSQITKQLNCLPTSNPPHLPLCATIPPPPSSTPPPPPPVPPPIPEPTFVPPPPPTPACSIEPTTDSCYTPRTSYPPKRKRSEVSKPSLGQLSHSDSSKKSKEIPNPRKHRKKQRKVPPHKPKQQKQPTSSEASEPKNIREIPEIQKHLKHPEISECAGTHDTLETSETVGSPEPTEIVDISVVSKNSENSDSQDLGALKKHKTRLTSKTLGTHKASKISKTSKTSKTTKTPKTSRTSRTFRTSKTSNSSQTIKYKGTQPTNSTRPSRPRTTRTTKSTKATKPPKSRKNEAVKTTKVAKTTKITKTTETPKIPETTESEPTLRRSKRKHIPVKRTIIYRSTRKPRRSFKSTPTHKSLKYSSTTSKAPKNTTEAPKQRKRALRPRQKSVISKTNQRLSSDGTSTQTREGDQALIKAEPQNRQVQKHRHSIAKEAQKHDEAKSKDDCSDLELSSEDELVSDADSTKHACPTAANLSTRKNPRKRAKSHFSFKIQKSKRNRSPRDVIILTDTNNGAEDPEENFTVGEMCLVFDGPKLLEATVLQIGWHVKEKRNYFFIHYHGWHTRWDSWAPIDWVCKDDLKYRDYQKYLIRQQARKEKRAEQKKLKTRQEKRKQKMLQIKPNNKSIKAKR